jgi:HD-GYP domain-containing protein (c-di-GMP phosphodiesterase class II)
MGSAPPQTRDAQNDGTVKRVAVGDLRPGMFIHDLACDWMNHPFLRNRFPIKSREQITRIRDAGLAFVFIDTRLGDDVAQPVPAEEAAAATESAVDAEMAAVARAEPAAAKVSGAAEMSRAKNVHAEATRYVKQFMADARLGKVLDVETALPLVERTTDSILRNSGALLSLCQVRDKDQYTFLHSVSVCALMIAFGRSLGFPRDELHQLGIGGLVHDLGKAFVPLEILNKPGRLTKEEFDVVKKHPSEGHRVLLETPGIGETPLTIVAQHHEKLDGTGYPHGLPAERIERIGRMGAICDIYDAITADRAYHRGIPPTRALRNLLEWSDNHLDRALVQAFIRCVGIYPVGSLVKLESGRLAVVLEQSESSLLEPIVRIVFDTKKNRFVTPEDLDLGRGGADRIAGYEDPVKFNIDTKLFM